MLQMFTENKNKRRKGFFLKKFGIVIVNSVTFINNMNSAFSQS